jgi:hypothetical protein
MGITVRCLIHAFLLSIALAEDVMSHEKHAIQDGPDSSECALRNIGEASLCCVQKPQKPLCCIGKKCLPESCAPCQLAEKQISHAP